MEGKFYGELIGYSTYVKDGKTWYVYEIFCAGKKDKATGLYTSECEIVRIREEEARIANVKPNMRVEFLGEKRHGKNGDYNQYSTINEVKA